MPDPKMIGVEDNRLVSIKKRQMMNTDVFTNHYYSEELLNIFTVKMPSVEDANSHHHCSDPERSYLQNSTGMRGNRDFDSNVDLLAIGCSQTFGLGIDEEAMWSKRMAESLGMSYATLAAPGWSIQEMVNAAMVYIKKYGKPKVLAALLPDFGRTIAVERKDLFLSDEGDSTQNAQSDDGPKIVVRPFHYNGQSDYPKLSKSPHNSADVFPTEGVIYTAAQAWATFIEYCDVGGIDLIWTSWDAPVLDSYSMVAGLSDGLDVSGFVYNNYHLDGPGPVEKLKTLACHQDIKDIWPTTFDVGSDTCQHYGVHAHVHVADMLVERYNYLNEELTRRT